VLQNLGDLQTLLAQHLAALQSYGEAIATHNRALTLAPHDIQILNNKGNTLQSLGRITN
jgi:Flp pilus assembly protein TadD